MTTIQIKGKAMQAVRINTTVVGTSQQYAEQAKKYRDEAEVFANMAGNYVNNFNDTVETSKTDISNIADMAMSEVQETVDEAQKTLEAKINELLGEVDNQLAGIVGE